MRCAKQIEEKNEKAIKTFEMSNPDGRAMNVDLAIENGEKL